MAEGNVGKHWGHRDEDPEQVDHLHPGPARRQRPGRAEQGPPVQERRPKEHQVFNDVHQTVLERPVIEHRRVPSAHHNDVG